MVREEGRDGFRTEETRHTQINAQDEGKGAGRANSTSGEKNEWGNNLNLSTRLLHTEQAVSTDGLPDCRAVLLLPAC
jgi:hypothetical protein